jgi:hypothetical protein
MYFEAFPTIPYTNVKYGGTKTVTNLLKRVAVREVIRDNTVNFLKYQIKSGETPEGLAFDVYDDAELHWVILLLNNIFDRYHQWPMNVNQFQSFLNDKYSNPNGVHHYEINQTSGNTTVTINIGSSNDDYASASVVTNFEYEERRQDELRLINLINPGEVGKFVVDYNRLIKS